MRRSITFLIGLPGSGKSTYIDDIIKRGSREQVLSPDDVREALGGYEKADKEKVVEIIDTQAKALMIRGLPILVDATNLNKDRLEKYTAMVKNRAIQPHKRLA